MSVEPATLAGRLGLFLVYSRPDRAATRAVWLPIWTLDPEAYRRTRVRLRVTAASAAADATWSGRW